MAISDTVDLKRPKWRETKVEIQIGLCKFKRTKNSVWEYGVIINHDKLIVDLNSKAVTAQIWTLQHIQGEMSMVYRNTFLNHDIWAV